MALPLRQAEPSSDVVEQVLAVLARYVSMPTARSILSLSRQRNSATTRLDRGQLRGMLDSLERSLRLFAGDPTKVKECRRELDKLAGVVSAGGAYGAELESSIVTVKIRVEDDVVRARNEARKKASELGFSTIGQTRLATAVSEVARNIVLYAGDGIVVLKPTTSPRGLEIVAEDRGPGIPNLEQIMAGDYRSKLGMGLGLRGVKKLADQFDVRTAAGSGTTVRFTMRVM